MQNFLIPNIFQTKEEPSNAPKDNRDLLMEAIRKAGGSRALKKVNSSKFSVNKFLDAKLAFKYLNHIILCPYKNTF